jgi:hypothetical protein
LAIIVSLMGVEARTWVTVVALTRLVVPSSSCAVPSSKAPSASPAATATVKVNRRLPPVSMEPRFHCTAPPTTVPLFDAETKVVPAGIIAETTPAASSGRL